jgi:competence protein ComEC
MRLPSIVLWVTGIPAMAWSAAASGQDAYLRVVDVGAGLCVVALVPGGHAMVYDTGASAQVCGDAVAELVPSRKIDLMVLSHSDIDHIGAARRILAEHEVQKILHPGDPRDGTTIARVRADIAQEPGASILDLGQMAVPFGTSFSLGEAKATFIAGWSNASDFYDDDPSLDGSGHKAERYNGISLVIRFEYGGHSVLLTGDTLGRIEKRKKDDTLCQYAERNMVENAAQVPLQSEILIGQHHGSDDSSSNCFIRAVKPTWVIFSAGHEYKHPRQSAADRFIANGVDKDRMLRTDRGDNEGGRGRGKEWRYGGIRRCIDKPGDDDIEITLSAVPGDAPVVRYRTDKTGC